MPIVHMTRRSSKGFLLLVNNIEILDLSVFGIWEDFGAREILLRDMPMICLQFGSFSKMFKIEKFHMFFSGWIFTQTV